MSNKETLRVNKTLAVLPHPPSKIIAGESQRDHQVEQEERVLLRKKWPLETILLIHKKLSQAMRQKHRKISISILVIFRR